MSQVREPVQEFLATESAGGIVLAAAAAVAIVWATLATASYEAFWAHHPPAWVGGAVAHLSLQEIAREGLMPIFFFVVGLEIKRELTRRRAVGRPRGANPRRGGGRRDGRPGADLRRDHPRGSRRGRVGDPDGHRHRVRGRGAAAAGLARPTAAEGVHAGDRGRRRHRGDRRHRRLVLTWRPRGVDPRQRGLPGARLAAVGRGRALGAGLRGRRGRAPAWRWRPRASVRRSTRWCWA